MGNFCHFLIFLIRFRFPFILYFDGIHSQIFHFSQNADGNGSPGGPASGRTSGENMVAVRAARAGLFGNEGCGGVPDPPPLRPTPKRPTSPPWAPRHLPTQAWARAASASASACPMIGFPGSGGGRRRRSVRGAVMNRGQKKGEMQTRKRTKEDY